jgi:hypothetical protein
MRRPKAPSSLVSSARGVVARGSVAFGRKGNTDGVYMLDPHRERENYFLGALRSKGAAWTDFSQN